MDDSIHGNAYTLFKGRELFAKLLEEKSVLAAAGMVRRECYERLGAFPLDMPHSGDSVVHFRFHYGAVYFDEPTVCYREHDLSASNLLSSQDGRICLENNLLHLWRVRQTVT